MKYIKGPAAASLSSAPKTENKGDPLLTKQKSIYNVQNSYSKQQSQYSRSSMRYQNQINENDFEGQEAHITKNQQACKKFMESNKLRDSYLNNKSPRKLKDMTRVSNATFQGSH